MVGRGCQSLELWYVPSSSFSPSAPHPLTLPSSPVAAAKAVQKVFNASPDYTREGGSIPVTLTFQEALKKSVLLLPMGKSDDGAHSINEKIDKRNYIEGINLLSSYLHEVAAVQV